MDALEHLRTMEPGWDGEEPPAPIPNDIALANAGAILEWLEPLLAEMDPNGVAWGDLSVDPDVLGGIGIEVADTTRRAWIACMNSGAQTLVLSRGDAHESQPWTDATRGALVRFLEGST